MSTRPHRSPAAWVETAKTFDLFFVGGDHLPNIEGVAAFLEGCYKTHLAPHGITFGIAGDVCASIPTQLLEQPGVVALGRVENLRPLYAAAKLVIVPLLEGTGISVKTLEAIALGKPVIATPAGLRGLNTATVCTLPARFDERWAKALLSLLDSREERQIWRNRLLLTIAAGNPAETLHAFDKLIERRNREGEAIENLSPFEQVAQQPLIEWPMVLLP